MRPSSPPTGAPPTKSAGTAAAAAADAAASSSAASSTSITVACAPTAASSCRITWHMQHPRRAKITTGLSRTSRPIRSAGASPSSPPAGSMVRPSRPPAPTRCRWCGGPGVGASPATAQLTPPPPCMWRPWRSMMVSALRPAATTADRLVHGVNPLDEWSGWLVGWSPSRSRAGGRGGRPVYIAPRAHGGVTSRGR